MLRLIYLKVSMPNVSHYLKTVMKNYIFRAENSIIEDIKPTDKIIMPFNKKYLF